jgi:hypothetical protein
MTETTTTEHKIRWTFDIVLAVEMAPAAIRAFSDQEPLVEPNGKSYFVLAEKRASCVLPDSATETEAVKKAVGTAAFFYKQDNPEWADSPIRGLSPELVKRSLAR